MQECPYSTLISLNTSEIIRMAGKNPRLIGELVKPSNDTTINLYCEQTVIIFEVPLSAETGIHTGADTHRNAVEDDGIAAGISD